MPEDWMIPPSMRGTKNTIKEEDWMVPPSMRGQKGGASTEEEEGQGRTILGTAGDVGVSLANGIVGLGESAVGIADIMTSGLAGKGLSAIGFDPKETKEIISKGYSPTQQEANRKVDEAEGFIDTVGAMLQNPSTIAHSVVESSPSMLGGAGIARGLISKAAGLSPLVAGAIGEGTISAGMAAEDIRQQTEDGLLTPKESAIAVGSGMGTMAFTLAGGRLAKKLGIDDIDTMLAGGKSTVTQKGVIKRIIGGGISEGAFEELPQSVQEQVWMNAATDKPLLEGVPEAGAQGMLTGAAMGGGANVVRGRGIDAAKNVPDSVSQEKPDEGMAVPQAEPTIEQQPSETTEAPITTFKREVAQESDRIRKGLGLSRSGGKVIETLSPQEAAIQKNFRGLTSALSGQDQQTQQPITPTRTVEPQLVPEFDRLPDAPYIIEPGQQQQDESIIWTPEGQKEEGTFLDKAAERVGGKVGRVGLVPEKERQLMGKREQPVEIEPESAPIEEVEPETKTPEQTSKKSLTKEPWEMTRNEVIIENPYMYGKEYAIEQINAAKNIEGFEQYGVKAERLNAKRKEAILESHKKDIQLALSEGKPVPPEVLKDYPDLAKATTKKPGKYTTEEVRENVRKVREKMAAVNKNNTKTNVIKSFDGRIDFRKASDESNEWLKNNVKNGYSTIDTGDAKTTYGYYKGKVVIPLKSGDLAIWGNTPENEIRIIKVEKNKVELVDESYKHKHIKGGSSGGIELKKRVTKKASNPKVIETFENKENGYTVGFHVRDTIVSSEKLNSLPKENVDKILELKKEFDGLGYVDFRTEMGPDQIRRLTKSQKKKFDVAREKAFGIEIEVKKLLKTDAEIKKDNDRISKLNNDKKLTSLLNRKRQIEDFLSKKLNSNRENSVKKEYRELINDIENLQGSITSDGKNGPESKLNVIYQNSTLKQINQSRIAVNQFRSWMRAAGLPKDVLTNLDIEAKKVVKTLGEFRKSKKEHRVPQKSAMTVLGATTFFDDGKTLVQYASDESLILMEDTAYHEAFHVIVEKLLPEKSKVELLDHFKGNEEDAAKAYAAYVTNKETTGIPKGIRKIFYQLRRALRRIANGFKASKYETVDEWFEALYFGGVKNQESGVNEFAQSAKMSIKKAAKKITDNPAFVKWFGDSKVVDENGEPLVVYHGTNEIFDKFKNNINWFSETPELASEYAISRFWRDTSKLEESVLPVYLSSKSIYDVTERPKHRNITQLLMGAVEQAKKNGHAFDEKIALEKLRKIKKHWYDIGLDNSDVEVHNHWHMTKGSGDILLVDFLEHLGFDGISFHENDVRTYGTFHPTQIKSIYNQGTFDPKNPDIRMSVKKKEKPRVEYIGSMEDADGNEVPLYNVFGHPDVEDGSTKTLNTIKKLGLKIPESKLNVSHKTIEDMKKAANPKDGQSLRGLAGINNVYDSKEDKWFSEKDYELLKNNVEASNFQNEIKEVLGLKRYNKKARDIDAAIHIYLDAKRNPNHFDEYYKDIDDEDKRIADLSRTIEGNPKLLAIANKIAKSYEELGERAKDEDVINDTIENYAGRVWEVKGRSGTDVFNKFITKSRHSKQRVFETILEGMATKGMKLKVKGATNNLKIVKDEIAKVIEDKKLLRTLQKTEHLDTGEMIFTDKPGLEGYKKLEGYHFYTWKPYGAVKGGKTKGTYINDAGKEVQVGKNARITKKYAVENPKTGRSWKNFNTKEEATSWMNENHPEGQIEERVTLWEKRQLFAPEAIANRLNKITGRSVLSGKLKVKGVSAVDVITKYNAVFKSTLLMTGFFHHQAFMRSYLFGVRNKTAHEWRPIKAYKEGLEAINNLDKEIELGVRNGLTIGVMQDWEEQLLQSETVFGRIMDKHKISKDIKDKLNSLRERQAKFLFGELGSGLKAKAFMIEHRNAIKEHPEMEENERARMVASLINADFGGLHIGRMGRDPTTQHIFRLLALAPDWTESNVLTMVRAIKGGSASETKMYRKFWTSVFTKAAVATIAMNIALSLAAGEDDDDFWKKYRKAWKEGNFKWMDINITPVYKALGGKEEAGKYFSLIGHFRDPIKFIVHPIRSAHHKGSVIYRFFHEIMKGTDWKGAKFTSFSELIGVDDKGVYLTTRKGKYRAGDKKGGKLIGQTTSYRSSSKSGPLGFSQIPSYMISQGKGIMPIQVQSLIAWNNGEANWFDALTKGMGLYTSTTYPTKKKIENEFLSELVDSMKDNEKRAIVIKQINEYNKRRKVAGDIESVIDRKKLFAKAKRRYRIENTKKVLGE